MLGKFDYQVIWNSLPLLGHGMWVTLQLTVIAIAGGIVLGTLLALMRLSKFKVLSGVAGSYVNFFRAMPLILVIFWFYFLAPMATGEALGSFGSVLIAFTLFEAAYYCEIIRAGIQSVTRSQINAGMALGLTYGQTMRYIILPLTAADMVAVRDNRLVEMYGTAALVYFVLCLSGSMWVKRLQRRYAL